MAPGNYRTTTRTVAVTDAVDSGLHAWNPGFRENAGGRNATVITDLDPGTALHLVEVVCRNDLGRVRGRIDQPMAGWISMENVDTSFRWVRPADASLKSIIADIKKRRNTDNIAPEFRRPGTPGCYLKDESIVAASLSCPGHSTTWIWCR